MDLIKKHYHTAWAGTHAHTFLRGFITVLTCVHNPQQARLCVSVTTKGAGDWQWGREKCTPAWILHYMCFCFNSHMCLFHLWAFPTHNCHRHSIKKQKTKKNSWPRCAPKPLGFAAPFCRGDFCGTRLQNRLDRVAVDSACPPAGSINSACQIFSLLCWAHSVAEQCINIHGDQSRASRRERVWCGGVSVRSEGRWRDKQPELSRTTHNQQVIFLPTSLCRLKLPQKKLFISHSLTSLHNVCTQLTSA